MRPLSSGLQPAGRRPLYRFSGSAGAVRARTCTAAVHVHVQLTNLTSPSGPHELQARALNIGFRVSVRTDQLPEATVALGSKLIDADSVDRRLARCRIR